MGMMDIHSRKGRGAILGGVRADATGAEAKKLMADIKTAFEEFKAANDKELADLKKGLSDTVQSEKVDRINASISDLQAQLADLATKQAAAQIGGGGDGNADEVKALASFRRDTGQDVSAEDFRAYGPALNTYMRRGQSTPSAVLAQMSVGADPDGGYTVTPDMSGRIVTRLREISPMRQLADVQTIGTDALEGFNDLGEAGAGWVGETQARPETDTPALGKWSIPVVEMYAEPKTTQKLLDDSQFDIEGWLADKVTDRFLRMEGTGYFTGTTPLQPRGLLTYPTSLDDDDTRIWGSFQHINTGVSGGFAAPDAGTGVSPGDVLIDLVYSLDPAYLGNANFVMRRNTVATVRKLKDAEGNYLWQPDFQARQGGTLVGHGIVTAEAMPAMAANSLAIAFGDFREAYTIVDRIGIRVLRDPLTSKGFVKFYTTKRTGGGAVNFDAVKFLRFGS
jgi:HK97 family phage major capsid protein